MMSNTNYSIGLHD